MTNDYSYINPKSFEESSNRAIAELHETIITLRARIYTLENEVKEEKAKLKHAKNDVLLKEKAFDNGLKLLNTGDDELLRLRKEVKYYEDNIDLVWKRRIRPEKLKKEKEEKIKKSVIGRLGAVGWQKVITDLKRAFDKDRKKFEQTQTKYSKLVEDNENMPVPDSVMQSIDERVTDLQNELKLAKEDVEYYKKFIKDKDIITKRLNATGRQQRRSLRDQLGIKR
jgi:hypothetical protein|tara:strand:+ start:4119 stop:4793 length:675 start_codon:yes stop_codon:yes gene_type:complete